MPMTKTPAVATLVAAALTAMAAPAAAEDLRYRGPRKVVVNQAYERVGWRLEGADLGRVDDVTVTLEHVSTRQLVDGDFVASRPLSGTLRIYDFHRSGRYTIYGPAYDGDVNELTPAPAYLTVKRACRVRLSARRSGGRLVLRAAVKRYDGGYPLWQAHRRSTVRFQRLVRGGWRTIGRRVVPSSGVTTLSVRKASRSTYRVAVAETRRVWDRASAAVRR